MSKATRKHNEYIDAIMGKDRCSDCHHWWWEHKRQPNGALACTHFGCGCKDVEMPARKLSSDEALMKAAYHRGAKQGSF